MPAELDAVLAQRFEALSSARDDSDWTDVRLRAGVRPSRRLRLAAVALVLILGTLLAAPALGLDERLGQLFEDGEPAPPPVQKDFSDLDVGAPPGMAPGVKANATRHVATFAIQGRRVRLWVAPTRAGGYCFTFEEKTGGCNRKPPTEFGVTVETGVNILFGGLPRRVGATLWLVTNGGVEHEIPLVWVGAPIDSGFFAYEVPDELGGSSTAGSRLVVRDSAGRTVSRTSWDDYIPPPDLDGASG
jgi:hypothetical protein